MNSSEINITFKGKDYKVFLNKAKDDLIFAVKKYLNNKYIKNKEFDEENAMREFSVLRKYLKDEGFFMEYFKNEKTKNETEY
jgi:hypothetical protein